MDKANVVAATVIDGNVWYFTSGINALVQQNIESGKILKTRSVPGEKYTEKLLYVSLNTYQNKIFLTPLHASNNLVIYDMLNDSFRKIPLRHEGDNENVVWNYQASIIVGDKLFIFGVGHSNIIRINCESEELKHIDAWAKETDVRNIISNDIYFRKQCVLLDDNIYIPFCNYDAILKLNCTTEEVEIIKIEKHDSGYSGIELCNNEMFLTPRKNDGYFYKYSLKNKTLERISSYKSGNDMSFAAVHIINGEIVVFPAVSKQIETVDSNVKIMPGAWNYISSFSDNLIMSKDNNIYIWNDDITESAVIKANFSDEDIDYDTLYGEQIVMEEQWRDLQSFIGYVASRR